MTPEQALKLIPVIQAYAEGKTIQYRTPWNESWYDYKEPSRDQPHAYRFPNNTFPESTLEWRVKPGDPREWWLCGKCSTPWTEKSNAEDCCRSSEDEIVHVREVIP